MSPFYELLDQHADARDPAERARIEALLWERFGVRGAVFVLDMSGFSRVTMRHGVVHYLSMIRRMQRVIRPILDEHGGEVVKFEADNCFAWFPDAPAACAAAIDANRAFASAERSEDLDDDIRIEVGIDYGRFLAIPGRDLYGNPVNLASKLGEDVARPGEVLVTHTAWERLDEALRARTRPLTLTVSGVEIRAHAVPYEA